MSSQSLFARIRSACARVVRGARCVAIDDERVASFSDELSSEGLEVPGLDPAHHYLDRDETTLAYVISVNAINFGSGWFPLLRKRPGCSGYLTIATIARERFRAGAFTAEDLARSDVARVTALFEQDANDAEVGELMAHFARAWRDLGEFLIERYRGRFAAFVEDADRRAERMVGLLAQMPFYRDVSSYRASDAEPEFDVPLYKRAQITASDLAHAFGGRGFGHFDDLESLTLFADNLVPHTLRCEGVLRYDPGLLERIERGERLEPGSREEVEIRAAGLHAVERMVEHMRARGAHEATASLLDGVLWTRGQDPRIKAHPRHRARSVYY